MDTDGSDVKIDLNFRTYCWYLKQLVSALGTPTLVQQRDSLCFVVDRFTTCQHVS